MKLADFLFRTGMSTATLRRLLGIRHRSTITRYLNGMRIPNHFTLRKIEEITEGQVTLRDFLSPRNPECAIIVILPSGRKRMVFPWTYAPDDPGDDPPDPINDNDPSLPVQRAVAVLGNRIWWVKHGQWLLDGRPADFRRVVREANKLLRMQRLPVIRYPGIKDDE